jgi:hypothetical protein
MTELSSIDAEIQTRIEAHMKELAREVKEGKIQSIACALVKRTGEVAFFDVTVKGPLTMVGLLDVLKSQIETKFLDAVFAAMEQPAVDVVKH